MDFNNLAFEDLADATIDLNSYLLSMENKTDYFKSDSFVLQKNEQAVVYPSSPGFIYKLEKWANTFCIRGIATTDIAKTFNDYHQADQWVLDRLKIEPQDQVSEVKYFECENFNLAQTAAKQLINRRFPYCEDLLCNISDPGYSWWMSLSDCRIQIYFNSHGINRTRDLIKLGPIGDTFLAKEYFSSGYYHFSKLFPVDEFSCDDQSICLGINKDSKSYEFECVKQLLVEGDYLPFCKLEKVVYFSFDFVYFLKGLAVTRKFWREINNSFLM
ncbi:MAG: hypothetical protein ISR65_02995 [Bacteriovoracaceae bacterium]|nr:hypothetical protein [Bacteriovoracaceae bacterium]